MLCYVKGRTGFPWIDACMRQLIQEGWMHHICRNSVAVFLTRGALYLSWEKGMDVFMKYQIDVRKEVTTILHFLFVLFGWNKSNFKFILIILLLL